MEDFTFRRFNEQDAILLYTIDSRVKSSPRKKKAHSPSRPSHNYSSSYSSPRAEKTFSITSQSDIQYNLRSFDDYDSLLHLRYTIQSDIAQLLTEIHPLRKKLKDMEDKTAIIEVIPPQKTKTDFNTLENKLGENEHIRSMYSNIPIQKMKANLLEDVESLNLIYEQCLEITSEIEKTSRKKAIFLSSDIYKNVCAQRQKMSILDAKIEKEEETSRNLQNELEFLEKDQSIKNAYLSSTTDSPENISRLQDELVEKQATLKEAKERYSQIMEAHENEISVFQKEYSTSSSLAPPTKNNTYTNGRFRAQKQLRLSFNKNSDEFFSTFYSSKSNSNDFPNINNLDIENSENDKNTNDVQNKSKHRIHDKKIETDKDPIRKKTSDSVSPRQRKYSPQKNKPYHSRKSSDDSNNSTLNLSSLYSIGLPPSPRCISVGLFAKPIKEKEIKNLFSQYGEVEDIEIFTKTHVYPSQYYANIRFSNHESAQKSIDKANHKKYKDTVLSVKWATNQNWTSSHQPESQQNTIKAYNSNNSLSMTLSASPKPPQESSSQSPQRSTKSNKSKNQQTSSDKMKNNENPNSSSHINGKNIEKNSRDFPVRQLNSHHKRVLSLSSTLVQEAPNKRKTDPNSLSEPDLTFSSEFAAIRNNNNTYSPNIRVSVQNSIISVESSLDLPEIVKYKESFIEKPVEKPKVKPPPKTTNDIESKVSNKSVEKEKFQLPPLKLNLGQYVNNDQNINLSPIEKKKSDTTGFSFEEDDYDVNDISISNTVEDISKIIKNNGKQSQSSDIEANSDSSRTLFSTDSEPDRIFNLLEISDSEKTTVNKKSPKLPPSSLVTSPRPRYLGVASPRSKEAEDAKDKKKEEKTVSKDKPTSKPKVSRPKDNYPENKQEESIRFKLPAKKNQPSHSENNEKEENPRNKLPDKKGAKGKSSDSSDEESKEKSSDSIDITSSEENQKNKTVDQKDKSSIDSSSSDKKGNKKTLDQTFGFSVSGSNGNSEKEEEEEEEKKEDKSTNETSITANSSISEKEKEKKEKSTLENTAKKMLDGTFGFSVSNSSGEESEDEEKDDQKYQKKVNTSDTEVHNNKNSKKSSSSNDGVLTTDSSSYENENRDKNKSSSNYEKIDLDSSSYEKDNKSTTEETTSDSSNIESNSDQIHQKKSFTKKENTPNFKIENKNKPTPRKTKNDPSDNETIKVVKDDQAKKPKSVVSINFIQSSSEIVNKRSRKNEKEAKNGSTESFKFSDYSSEQLKNNKDGKIEKSKLIEKNPDTKKLQEKVNTIQKQKETIQRNNKSNTNINNMNDKNKKESSDSIGFTTSSLSDKNQKKQPFKQKETILDTKNTNQKKMNPKENKKENNADSTNKKSHKPEAIKIQPSSSNYEVLIIDSNSDENDEKESESSSSNIEVIDIESGSDEKDTEKETSDTSSDSQSDTDHSNHKKSSKSKGNNKKDNNSDSSEETEIKKENKSTSDKVDIPDTPQITPQKNSASLPKLKFKFFDKHIAPPSPSPSNDNEEKSDSSFSKSSINSSINPVIDAIKDKNEKKEEDFDSSSSSDDEKKKSKKNDDFDSSDSDEKKDEDSFDPLNIKNSKTKDEDSFDFSDSDEKEKQKKDEKLHNSSENTSNSKSNNTITKSSKSTIEILSIFSSSDDEKKSEKDGKNKGQTSDSENQKVSSASDEIEEIDSSSSSSDKDKKDDFSSDIEVLDILSDSNEEKPKEKQKPRDISKSQMKQKKEFKKTNQNSDLGSTGPKKFPPLLNIAAIAKLSSTNPKK